MGEWNVIKNKKIIDLFIGSTSLDIKAIYEDLRMPYMKIEDICSFGELIGIRITNTGKKMSRWEYMEKVVDYAITNKKVDLFFKELISMERFEYLVDEITYGSSPQEYYWKIIYSLFIRINDYLQFKRIFIEYDLLNYKFEIKNFNDIEKQVSNEKKESKEYKEIIKSFCNKAKNNGLNTKYGQITNIKDPGIQGGNGRILFGILNGKEIAIKVLFESDKNKSNRFFNEFVNVFMSLQKVNGVVELYSYEEVEFEKVKICFIIMKKYEKSLVDYRITNQNELIIFIYKFLKIVKEIHKKGIIHRDIKPENILLDENNNIVLTDFGIAYFNPKEFENTGHTISKEFLCNRKFSAPEQMEKSAIPKETMDIYAIGQIIQYVVTGKSHNGTERVNLGRIIDGDKINVIDKMVNKCLCNEPEKRYQSIEEMIKIIELNCLGTKEKHIIEKHDFNYEETYEYVCLNYAITTKKIADDLNYDLNVLKTALKKMWMVKGVIKPAFITDNPDDDECHWIKK